MEKLPSDASQQEKELLQLLLDLDQRHLFEAWPAGDAQAAEKHRFLRQVAVLQETLPGGLAAYYENAKVLLQESSEGVNPFEGYAPSVPEGEAIAFDDDKFEAMEELGLREFEHTAVVLVAGGLGERLGYSGIKLELPVDLLTELSYLEFYCRWIQGIERRLNLPSGHVPFAIMTSDDTHARTVALLEKHAQFGLPTGQVQIVKQETVPALCNNRAHFVCDDGDAYRLQTKPQGHGVVHTLLHKSGLAAAWLSTGKKWIAFIQDTNAPNFRCLLPTLGVSASRRFDVNSVATKYRPGEPVGAICHLTHQSKRPLTLNVEYNQLGLLLGALGKSDEPDGDGYSQFPGNINLLVFATGPYVAALQASGGQVPNFVNPKYADEKKQVFKKPTRLECMMQDFPRLLPEESSIGFTCFDLRHACLIPCKNSIADGLGKLKAGLPADTASTAEHSMFLLQGRYLERVGVQVDLLPSSPVYGGIPLERYPHLALLPSFAVTRFEMRRRFKAGKCHISESSTLVLDGDIEIEHLDLNGTLTIQACKGAKVVVKHLMVQNVGWQFLPLADNEADVPEYLRIRGYRMNRLEERSFKFDQPGEYCIDEPSL